MYQAMELQWEKKNAYNPYPHGAYSQERGKD